MPKLRSGGSDVQIANDQKLPGVYGCQSCSQPAAGKVQLRFTSLEQAAYHHQKAKHANNLAADHAFDCLALSKRSLLNVFQIACKPDMPFYNDPKARIIPQADWHNWHLFKDATFCKGAHCLTCRTVRLHRYENVHASYSQVPANTGILLTKPKQQLGLAERATHDSRAVATSRCWNLYSIRVLACRKHE